MNRMVDQGATLTVDFKLNSLVVQPTSLCNLNCTYCYLSSRDTNLAMTATTAAKIADELAALDLHNTVNVIWHSGEPLTCGVKKLTALLEPFESLRKDRRVRHSVQTNATLINEKWCDLFLAYDFSVGVSLDGPKHLTGNRVDWNGKEAYPRIIAGINRLNDARVGYGIICVVTEESIAHAQELYDFFEALGCKAVGFNIVEEEGLNKNLLLSREANVTRFWADLLDAWLAKPSIEVREFRKTTVWMQSEVADKQASSVVKDILPSVAYNGDVVLMSPEFLGIRDASAYGSFVVGNILRSTLSTIIDDGLSASYIKDYLRGMEKCQKECEYFSYCRGGDASNKFFESGTLNVTETNYCRNTRMNLVDAVLERLE